VARRDRADLVRLQCYEGLDEARALYEWNYKKQLLRIQAVQGDDRLVGETPRRHLHRRVPADPSAAHRDPPEQPTVLLIDEVDKTDVEVEGLLLEVLSDFQVTIPELGTLAAVRRPYVVLTSNASRELSEALKRRCLYLHLDYPDEEREREIVLSQVPDLEERVVAQLVATVARLRELELKKAPSIAESVDWARTLIALEIRDLDDKAVDDTLGVVLKHASDQERAVRSSGSASDERPGRTPHRLPGGAAGGRAAGLAGRGPRRRGRAECAAVGPPRHRARGVRRHPGQEAEPAADLRRALRRVLPAAGRRGGPRRGHRRAEGPVRDKRRGAGGVPRAARRGARRR
jgi:MoxR-like ATPase